MVDNRVDGNLLVAQNGQGADIGTSIDQAQTAPLGIWTGNTICSDQILAADCTLDGTVLWERQRVGDSDVRLGAQTIRNGRFDSSKIAWTSWPSLVRIRSEERRVGKECRSRWS